MVAVEWVSWFLGEYLGIYKLEHPTVKISANRMLLIVAIVGTIGLVGMIRWVVQAKTCKMPERVESIAE